MASRISQEHSNSVERPVAPPISKAALVASVLGAGAFGAVLQFGFAHILAPIAVIMGVGGIIESDADQEGRNGSSFFFIKDVPQFLFGSKAFAISLILASIYGIILLLAPPEWPFYPDEAGYVQETAEVATLWSAGKYPRLEGRDYLGTLHTGYQRLGALSTRLTGIEPVNALRSLNIAVLFCLPWLMTALASRRPDPAAFGWLLLAAAHPLHAYWAVFCLREVMLLAALLSVLVLASRFVPRLRGGGSSAAHFFLAFALAAALFWLFTLRSYWAAIAVVAITWWALFNVYKIRLMSWLPGLAFLVLIMIFVPLIARTMRQMADTLASLALAYPADPAGALLQAGQAVPRLLWGPYPWAVVPEFRLFYLIFPAIWIQALLIWPAALPRWWRALRSSGTEGLIAIVIAFSALSILIAFAGDAPRHTYPLMSLATLLPVMLPGHIFWGESETPTKKQKVWFAVYYGTLTLFIVLQTTLWLIAK